MGGLFLAEFGYPLGACLLSGIAQGEAQFLEICPSEERSYIKKPLGKNPCSS